VFIRLVDGFSTLATLVFFMSGDFIVQFLKTDTPPG